MDKFKEIFEGNNSAYGIMKLTGETTSKGKAVAKAFIKREKISDYLWEEHLAGSDPALGIIPINENNMCRWGCIDVDEYNLDHLVIMRNIKGMNLPLVTFRSKSGGAHLFLFAKEFIPATLMQSKLKAMSEALGYGGSEIFPKQTEILVERGDTGNFLNLPYHGGTRGLRYTFKAGGEAASLEEFYTIYEEWSQTREQIESIVVKEKVKTKEAFEDGPPCLNKLADEGFGEGSRNNALFNVSVFCKKAHPDDWENQVGIYNQKYMDPPLSYQEVQLVIKSVNKKGYDKYRCKEQPICSACNPAKCRTKKHGVGFEEEQMPELDTLTKIKSNPPQWFLNVGGKRVELTSVQLHNPDQFALAVLDQADMAIPTPTKKNWREVYLNLLLQNLQEIEPLESLDPINQIINLLYDFTVNRPAARTKEDILNKMSFTEEGFTYFRMDDFFSFCKRNNWESDKVKTGNLMKQLEDIFVEEVRMNLKNQTPRVVKIKAMKKDKPALSKVKYEETPF
jgi:hypothetical protein|tara:strand:+ start:1186 stop:2709 length:1524 start_codon:yes stop_codon:yes gene_type:complete